MSEKQLPVRTACVTRLWPLLLWLLLTLPAVVRAQFDYTIDNTITITGYTGPDGAVVVPDTINGVPVTRIGGSAFYAKTGLTSVTMPGSLTSIGDSAFAFCISLTNVTIPNSVTSIGYHAFYPCTSLSTITVDALNSVYSSVDGVLFNKSQTLLIQCPEGKVGSYTIPNSVIGIGDSAFRGCHSLTNLTIPSSVTGIWSYAFEGCYSLTNLTIPSSVTGIGGYAFAGCTSLTNVTIPNSVTDIGQYAFASCTSLTSLTLGSGVTNIGSYAFYYCYRLSTITVDALNSVYSSVDGVLFNKSQTLLIRCPEAKAGSYTIPGSVTSIGDSALRDCTGLTSVTIPNSVTNIGDFAFYDCASLTSVTIPNSVTTIPDWAFGYCTSLTSVTIGNGVTSIGYYTFTGCTSLSAITVDAPNSIYSSLDGVLFNKSQTLLIQCPDGKLGSYTIPNSVTSIGYYALADCTKLTSVAIPNSVTNIESGAFAACTSLTGVTIPNSVTAIPDWAFGYCTSLTSITIGNGVTSIGHYAFADCTSLTSVTIPNNVTNIGNFAFVGCTSLISVTIPNSVTNIGAFAFASCTNLTGVYFQGNAFAVIGFDLFDGVDNATVYYLPNTTGWGTTFAGRPTAMWKPRVQTGDASFGVRMNQFGFNITWASGTVVVVEAATDLANPAWIPLRTNTLIGGSSYFSDPEWTNHPARFYRLRSP